MMDVIETTRQLVRIPSVNPDYDPNSRGESGMVDWLRSWAVEHGFEWQVQDVLPGRQNILIHIQNGGEHPHLMLNGHTDTVAVDEMTIPPFEAKLENGRVWGRGTADMKGPVACMLHALLQLREQPDQWKGKITLSLVMDEECHFQGVLALLDHSREYDYAIVGEPTRSEVIRGCKGCLRFWVRAHGLAAHSSTPHKGRNAIRAMARAVVMLEDYFTEVLGNQLHPDFGSSTGSVGLIRGGSGVNIVPDFCEVSVDIRLIPGQDAEGLYQEIQDKMRACDESVGWEFDPLPLIDTPFLLEANHPLVDKTCCAVEVDTSKVVNFSCDASKIAKAGIPCIIFGPGDIAEAHTANESIAVTDLHQGVEDYVRIVRTLLKP